MRAAEFRLALRRFDRRTELVVREHGLTPQRYLLLLLVTAAPGRRSTVTELGERMELAQSTVTELVQRAERAGLIDRERLEADGRISSLRATPEGERRFLAAFAALRSDRDALARAFSHANARFRALTRSLAR